MLVMSEHFYTVYDQQYVDHLSLSNVCGGNLTGKSGFSGWEVNAVCPHT